MNSFVHEVAKRLGSSQGASRESLERLEKIIGTTLPSDYVAFIKIADGATGWIGEHALLQLWPVDEIATINDQAEVADFAPGMLLFGGDGCGMVYGFDIRSRPMRIVETPLEVLSWENVHSAWNSFEELLESLANRGPDD